MSSSLSSLGSSCKYNQKYQLDNQQTEDKVQQQLFHQKPTFFSSVGAATAVDAAAATGAETETGAPPPAAFNIKSSRFFFSASLANKLGQ